MNDYDPSELQSPFTPAARPGDFEYDFLDELPINENMSINETALIVAGVFLAVILMFGVLS